MRKIFAIVIAGMILFNAGFGVFLGPLLYTLTPLQRHYLGAYLLSSWKAKDLTATTEVRWVWKFKPEATPQAKRGANKGLPKYLYALATEDDLVPVSARDMLWKGGRLSFLMSRKAELEGWSSVVWLVPVQVNSAQLADSLRHDFFEGEPAWRFFVQPVLLLVCCGVLWLGVSAWRDARWERNSWQTPVPFWRGLRQRAIASGAVIRKQTEPRRAEPKQGVTTVRTEPEPALTEPVSTPARSTAALPVAARPGLRPTLWDESKGLE